MSLSRLWAFRGCLGALGSASAFAFLCLQTVSSPASAAITAPADGQRLPAIKQVAVMPVYWQGQFPEGHPFASLRQHLDRAFSPLAQASKRFIFTNDVITADLWATPEGRKELTDEYEIDAMLNLSITAQNDVMLWSVRLLDPNLKTYLSETERVPYSWFLAASPSEIDQRLQNLTYRLLNRYPIDVFITSVQGRFVSLSSGSTQNVFEGDELSFYETKLKSQHPVDGSWLSFEQKLLGKAKVIESKEQSSIAQITSLSYENALGVGDGAKVAGIATRRSFQAAPPAEQRYIPVDKDSAIVQAPGDWQKPLTKVEPPSSPVPAREVPKPVEKPNPPRLAEAPSNETKLPPQAQPTPEMPIPNDERSPMPLSSSGGDEMDISNWIATTFTETNFIPGIESLSFRGSNKLSSKLPTWLLNRLSLRGHHDFSSEWMGIHTATLRMGSSIKGDYLGASAQSEILFKLPILNAAVPSLNRLLLGGLARIETLGVNGETFGGWDIALVGPSFRVQGSQHLAELVQTIDYDFAFHYFVAALGSAGIAGKKRDLTDGSAFEVELGAVVRGKPDDWEWGGQILLHDGSWSLSKGSLSHEDWSISLLGRRKF